MLGGGPLSSPRTLVHDTNSGGVGGAAASPGGGGGGGTPKHKKSYSFSAGTMRGNTLSRTREAFISQDHILLMLQQICAQIIEPEKIQIAFDNYIDQNFLSSVFSRYIYISNL